MNHRQKIKRFRQRIYALPRVRSRSLNPRCAAQIENGARWLHAFAVWRKLAHQGSSDAEIQAAYFYGIAKCKGKGLPCRFGSLGGRHAEALATAVQRKRATGKGNICWPASTTASALPATPPKPSPGMKNPPHKVTATPLATLPASMPMGKTSLPIPYSPNITAGLPISIWPTMPSWPNWMHSFNGHAAENHCVR